MSKLYCILSLTTISYLR